jgi:hypothetical protein
MTAVREPSTFAMALRYCRKSLLSLVKASDFFQPALQEEFMSAYGGTSPRISQQRGGNTIRMQMLIPAEMKSSQTLCLGCQLHIACR